MTNTNKPEPNDTLQGEVTADCVERFLDLLDRSEGVQGVHIDSDDCAALADAIRAAMQSAQPEALHDPQNCAANSAGRYCSKCEFAPEAPLMVTDERQARWAKWPNGDAGDAIDYACNHAGEPVFFLEDWRKDGAQEWPEYHQWLKFQRESALAALKEPGQ